MKRLISREIIQRVENAWLGFDFQDDRAFLKLWRDDCVAIMEGEGFDYESNFQTIGDAYDEFSRKLNFPRTVRSPGTSPYLFTQVYMALWIGVTDSNVAKFVGTNSELIAQDANGEAVGRDVVKDANIILKYVGQENVELQPCILDLHIEENTTILIFRDKLTK